MYPYYILFYKKRPVIPFRITGFFYSTDYPHVIYLFTPFNNIKYKTAFDKKQMRFFNVKFHKYNALFGGRSPPAPIGFCVQKN